MKLNFITNSNLKRATSVIILLVLVSCGMGLYMGRGAASVSDVVSNGDGTKTVTVDGTDFVTGVTVTINGFNCAGVQIISSVKLTCIIAESVEVTNVTVHYPSDSGGSGGASGGGSGGSSLTHYTIFVTSVEYNGNLGGLSGADAKCATRAVLGTATSSVGGTWKAILSSAGNPVNGRLILANGAFAIKNTGGQTVFNTASSIWSSALVNAVNYDENGTLSPSTRVWTGSSSGGETDDDNCNGFATATGPMGKTGAADRVTGGWLSIINPKNCDVTYPIYCINSN